MAARVEVISKLKRRYPKEWLLLTNVVADELTRPIKGKLVAHSKNRDDIYDRLARVRAKSACVTYTGQIPKDLVVVFFFRPLMSSQFGGWAARPQFPEALPPLHRFPSGRS